MTELLYETRGKVAIVTINRPDQRNALNHAVRSALFEAWDQFENDASLRVAILTGAGDKAFCAGADLKELAEGQVGVPPPDYLPVIGQNVRVTKPVIAAVNGAALAGGWLMAQMCDLCVAANTAMFGVTEARVGRGMPWATPLIHMLPQRIVMEALLTGIPLTAKRLYDLGYVNRLVAPDRVLDEAFALAAELVDAAPLTVAAAKESVVLATEMGRTAALRAATHVFERVYRSQDAQEGPRAFRERRKPVWRGS